jgi:hypothetical protein
LALTRAMPTVHTQIQFAFQRHGCLYRR